MKKINYGVFILLFIVLALTSCRKQFDRPDILFIVVDDLNDWNGFLGGKDGVYTPNLNKLASSGALFTNAHCTAPLDAPSRTSVMTGIRPSSSGIYANNSNWRKSPVLSDAKTLPEYFSGQGYTVKGGGKVFHALSWDLSTQGIQQNDPGIWDDYFPSLERSLPESVWPDSSVTDSTGIISWPAVAGDRTSKRPPWFFDYGPLGREEQTADYQVVEWAVDEMKKNQDKPLFLAVGLYRPHLPWFVPKEYFDMYPPGDITLPKATERQAGELPGAAGDWVRSDWQEWVLEQEEWKNAVRAYQASVSFSDAMLGRLIRGLRRSGRDKNTIIVLWSDHGIHLGEKNHWGSATLWEESTRVPLMIITPGMKKDIVCQEAVSLLDIYPTLTELTGGTTPEKLEGQSLVPLLNDPEAERPEPALSTFHYQNHSVRTERWRYIRYKNGEEELYDHWNDPDELYNLAGKPEHSEIIRELKKWLPRINHEELK